MSDAQDAPVTLPVRCVHCRGEVTLQMSKWPKGLAHDTLQPDDSRPYPEQVWPCPWCGQENRGGFAKRLAWVTKGHGPEGAA